MAEAGQVKTATVTVSGPQRERYETPRVLSVSTDRRGLRNTEGGLTPAQRIAAAQVESQIRKRRTETARAITDDGRVINISVGSGSRSRAGVDRRLVPANSVLTHNHPHELDQPVIRNGRVIGVTGGGQGMGARIVSSLSGDDIRLAIMTNAKEVRAVTPTYTFSVRRPRGGWGNVDADSIMREWYSAARRFKAENQPYARSGREQLGRYNAVMSHAVTRDLAKKYGWTYTRRRAV